MRETDLADELFGQPGKTALPAGVRVATARQGGVTITRVEIAREGLARPRGRYVTLEVPSVSLLDERDSAVIEAAAAELRPLLPPKARGWCWGWATAGARRMLWGPARCRRCS